MNPRPRPPLRAAILVGALLLAGPLAAQPARSPFEPPPVASPPIPSAPDTLPLPDLPPGELLAPAGMSFSKRREPRRRRPVVALATAKTKAPADDDGGWRRAFLYSSVAGAALGLAAGGAALYIAGEKTGEFNRYRSGAGTDEAGDESAPEAQRCGVKLPDRGAPGCRALLDDRDQARRYALIAFGAAGALATTALVLLFTEPERNHRLESRVTGRRGLAFSCTPGLGPSATCGLRF